MPLARDSEGSPLNLILYAVAMGRASFIDHLSSPPFDVSACVTEIGPLRVVIEVFGLTRIVPDRTFLARYDEGRWNPHCVKDLPGGQTAS